MNYFNVENLEYAGGLQGEMRVLSVTDFAEERFKRSSAVALFGKRSVFVHSVTS